MNATRLAIPASLVLWGTRLASCDSRPDDANFAQCWGGGHPRTDVVA